MTDTKINEAVWKKLGHEGKRQAVVMHTTNEVGFQTIPPKSYSTDIGAAWEIVEKYADGFALIQRKDKTWKAGFVGYEKDVPDEFTAEADTAPLSICLAFLKLEGK